MKTVIVSATRTPIGKYLGGLKDVPATQLGSIAIGAAIKKAGLQPEQIDECVFGQVIQAGSGQNPARQASLGANLKPESFASTINVVCGSGMRAAILASQSLQLQDAKIIVAGGMENMSRSPYLMFGARQGYKAGHQTLRDANIEDGLWCAFENWHMGNAAENTAKHYNISRQEQDEFALHSHQKAIAAQEAEHLAKEITPVEIKTKKGSEFISTDESPRQDSSLEALTKLKPAFLKEGTVTAGNAPGLSDGAAALIITTDDYAKANGLTPLAEIVAYSKAGLEPKWFTTTPVPASRALLEKTNMGINDIDLFEYNEAFAVQSLAVMKELKISPEKINVFGGAVALGHPIGCSGARILVTLLNALETHNKEIGLASLCMGGANGLAMMLRRMN